jgi:hypothetical protein
VGGGAAVLVGVGSEAALGAGAVLAGGVAGSRPVAVADLVAGVAEALEGGGGRVEGEVAVGADSADVGGIDAHSHSLYLLSLYQSFDIPLLAPAGLWLAFSASQCNMRWEQETQDEETC